MISAKLESATQPTDASGGFGITPLRDREFSVFQKLLYEWTGIYLNDTKKALVSVRLAKRLRHYQMQDFSEYLRLVESGSVAEEKQTVINLLTTNETYFFREAKHFDWFRGKISQRNSSQPFRVWSAAAATGQEAYSLAMVLADTIGMSGWDIIGTDISERALSVAEAAVYPIEQATQISESYLKKFCLKGVRSAEGTFCIAPELANKVRFFRLNLNEAPPRQLGLFDAIFLRNVMIYFDRATRQRVSENLSFFLKPAGNLVVGHAESLHSITNLLRMLQPTIYGVAGA